METITIKHKFWAGIMLVSILFSGCQKQIPLIQNNQRLADIHRMLDVQKKLTANSLAPIWDVFNWSMSADERQAMKFMYAYMPLSDLADYQASFFLINVQQSLKVREEMPWGKDIPEDVFLHFVLPLRVNNENLDSFRMVMYPEIKARIEGMNMKDAALEINHWCHEKVTYRGTDSRTSAPLSTINKSFGRCGEESTFTVTAMRTAGIPARQVYTPRWAHSDDNHAWVEVWIDGKWYYLGACEPEPDLNMGWFSEPARRTMLVHTRAYGRYFGADNVVVANDRFSELNLTANYAPVKTVVVLVKNADGTLSDSAKVEFQLYNYAEFYPIATNYTDKHGITRLTTGLGDLLVWSSKNNQFGYQKLSVSETDTLVIEMNKSSEKLGTQNYDMAPPHAVSVVVSTNEKQRAENDHRLALEDSIRTCYMKTFKDSTWAINLAQRLNLDVDTVKKIIAKSYGNWKEISAYLENNSQNYRHHVFALTDQLSDKDFSDASEAVLTNHLRVALKPETYANNLPEDIFRKYVLSPRIYIENLSPWRGFLQKEMGKMAVEVRNDITILTRWIQKNIVIDNLANMHSRAPLSPIGVYNLRVANNVSRDLFFVAVCRTFCIPARLNPETLVPEYMKNGEWLKVEWDTKAVAVALPIKGKLWLTGNKSSVQPQYYLHFTIGVFKGGFYRTLNFDEGKKLDDFTNPITLDTGRYVLVTGNRLEDGTVLSALTFFNVKKGETTHVQVNVRQQAGVLKPLGKLDFGRLKLDIRNGELSATISDIAKRKNIVLIVLDPDKEPSKHILNDLGPYAGHFDKWNGQFVLAIPAEKIGQARVLKTYTLPKHLMWGIDKDRNIFEAIDHIYGPGLKEKLPLVLLCDNMGDIYMFSAGYKIGIGEQLLKTISKLKSF